MIDNNRLPYKLKKLPLDNLDCNSLVSQVGQANRSIATFAASLNRIPDSTILLSPLVLGEAVASSRIENINTTVEEVIRHKIYSTSEEKQNDVMEVINYRRALLEATESLNKLPLAKRIVCQIHKTLLSGVRGLNKSPGNFRNNQVQIATSNGDIIYTPPAAPDIAELFGNLEEYIHSEEVDPLIQAAIVHAQFELIHPFLDGNGRTGRILIPLFLYHKKILNKPMFYISEYLHEKRSDYYFYLNGISSRNDWLNWIKFFLVAVAEQSQFSTQKIHDIYKLYEDLENKIDSAPAPKHYIKILQFIFSEPIFSAGELIKELAIPKSSCFNILEYLQGTEMISCEKLGKRNIYFFDGLHEIIKQ